MMPEWYLRSAVAALAVAAALVAPLPAMAAGLTVETVASGLEHPWALQFLPDGRMLVTERTGRLRVVGRDGTVSAAVSGLPEVDARGQGGLLDIALAADFATSGTLFWSYAEPRGNGRNATAVARGTLALTPTGGALSDVRVIFQQQPPIRSRGHFGSRIVIAPDGLLYVTLGDRQSERQSAQDLGTTLGKVVRIHPEGEDVPSNPYRLEGMRPEIWSYGHRNVQGATLEPGTGRLWTVEHGARGGDELNTPERGKNYGWPVITYGRDYSGATIGIGTAKPGMEQPVHYWDPSIAPSGLTFYTGELFPAWKGDVFVGALAGTALHRLDLQDGKVVGEEVLLKDRGERIRDVRQGPDGALWLLTDDSDGKLLRVSP